VKFIRPADIARSVGIRIAICQLVISGSTGLNLSSIEGIVLQNRADLYVFPELSLTGYSADAEYSEDIAVALDRLRLICNERDAAVVLGAPMPAKHGTADALLFITGTRTIRYDKLYPANFGIYTEQYTPGLRPVMVEFRGLKIGLEVCYDLFFPEISRYYARNGADLIICAAASAEPSFDYVRRMLPARALENTVYFLYCNSVGDCGGIRFFGCSGLYSPLGEEIELLRTDESIRMTYVDQAVVANARKKRPQLRDVRDDFGWS